MDERIWLTDDEQRAWRAYTEATIALLEVLDRQLVRESGISHSDYEVLVRLSEAPDRRLRMGELSALTLFSRSRLSHAVSRLEKRGWVRREGCGTDRRGTVAALTADGFEKLRASAPGHARTVRRVVFDQLDPAQVAQLEAIGTAVRRAAVGASAAPRAQAVVPDA